jgi:hypothetical protein
MMSHRSWMTGEDTPQQMVGMLERMTEMHKRLMSVMAAPQPAPQPQRRP